MAEIEPKEKRAKSSPSEFQAVLENSCCRQTKYNSPAPKDRPECESQGSEGYGCCFSTGLRLASGASGTRATSAFARGAGGGVPAAGAHESGGAICADRRAQGDAG